MSSFAGSPCGGRLEGTILRRFTSEVWVDTDRGVIRCSLRGKLRQAESCVCGDRVLVTPLAPGTGVLEKPLPRKSELRRGTITGDPQGRVTAANLDQVAVVISAYPPPPRWALADRLLVEAGRGGLESMVVVNKIDLAKEGSPERAKVEESAEAYRSSGIQVLLTSATEGGGLPELEKTLRDRMTVLSGHSGVGKTTLLNRLVPRLDLPTGVVNPLTGKGRQTTSSVVLVRLPVSGYVADTPGFREFALVGLSPAELGRYYPEFREAAAGCKFNDCLHRDEPGCALMGEVEAGRISKLRYQNYLQILRTLVETREVESWRKSARRRTRDTS